MAHEPPTCILTGARGEYADDCTTHEHEGELELGAPEADYRKMIEARKQATLGSTFALTPTDAILQLVYWHEDEVTGTVAALAYAENLVTRLAEHGCAIVSTRT